MVIVAVTVAVAVVVLVVSRVVVGCGGCDGRSVTVKDDELAFVVSRERVT